jgi:GABA(A) receptor-associated protein
MFSFNKQCQDFKDKYTFKQRLEDSSRVREKFPNRVPVIVQKSDNSGTKVPDIDKHKFLVPSDFTIGQMVYTIRKRIELSPEKAMFLMVNGVLAPTSDTRAYIDQQYKSNDGYTYLYYSGENTFGYNKA